MTPHEFVTSWNHCLINFDSPDMRAKVINDEYSIIWRLKDRVLKYKRVVFDDCYLTLHVYKRDVSQVAFKIGLVHQTIKTPGPETTHWQTLYLSQEQIHCPITLYTKLIIAAANLTRQGKIEPEVCKTLNQLILQTLENDHVAI